MYKKYWHGEPALQMEVMEMMSYKCNEIIYRIPRALHEVRTCVFCFELYLGNWHRLGYIVDAHFIYVTLILHILYAKTVMCLSGISSFNQRNICRLHDCYSFIHYMKNIKHLLCPRQCASLRRKSF